VWTVTISDDTCIAALLCALQDPAALNLLLLVAMRVTCLELSTTLDLLERNSLLQ
jgi:hypothetical protein